MPKSITYRRLRPQPNKTPLIQKNVLLKDFDSFARQQTDTLCSHIETYIRDNDSPLTYPYSGQMDKAKLDRQAYLEKPDKEGLRRIEQLLQDTG